MLEVLFIFIIGLFFGSFYLVVADRLGKGKSFITGRSVCEFCNHFLSWYELIPIVSFCMQRGACRHCKKKLSPWYPAAEITTGLLFSLIYILFMPLGIFSMLFAQIITSCLFIIFITDYKYEIIPFPIVAFGSIVALSGIYLTQPQAMFNHVLSGLISGLFFLLLFLVTRGKGMGFGDVVYAVFMGLSLGFPYILVGLYITFIGGAVISLILVALKKKKLHGGTVPFGPFLVTGTFIMLVAGQPVMEIISSYLGGIV
jgi:leader peptidase (prepilin peptidase)/N-methyltransferase